MKLFGCIALMFGIELTCSMLDGRSLNSMGILAAAYAMACYIDLGEK